jgi:hypothetical protein
LIHPSTSVFLIGRQSGKNNRIYHLHLIYKVLVINVAKLWLIKISRNQSDWQRFKVFIKLKLYDARF